MSEEHIRWGETAYTCTTNNTAADADVLTLEKLSDMMKEIRQKMDNDLMGRLLRPREWEQPLRSPQPDIKIDYPDIHEMLRYRSPLGAGLFPEIPILRSQYLPRGEALAVDGFGLIVGEGPATAQSTAVPANPKYRWPAWVLPVVLLVVLLVLTAVIGGM